MHSSLTTQSVNNVDYTRRTDHLKIYLPKIQCIWRVESTDPISNNKLMIQDIGSDISICRHGIRWRPIDGGCAPTDPMCIHAVVGYTWDLLEHSHHRWVSTRYHADIYKYRSRYPGSLNLCNYAHVWNQPTFVIVLYFCVPLYHVYVAKLNK